MNLDLPALTPPSGDYRTRVSKGYGNPRGSIILDETNRLELERISVEDCDRLIKAAAEIKTGILAYQEKAGRPHGRDHFYQGECQLCGKPEDDELHAEPPVIPPAERDCDAMNPDGSGEHCYRSGKHDEHRDSNGDTWAATCGQANGTDCPLPVDHAPDPANCPLDAPEREPLCDSELPLTHGGVLKCTLDEGHYGAHSALAGAHRWLGHGMDARNEQGDKIAPLSVAAAPERETGDQACPKCHYALSKPDHDEMCEQRAALLREWNAAPERTYAHCEHCGPECDGSGEGHKDACATLGCPSGPASFAAPERETAPAGAA